MVASLKILLAYYSLYAVILVESISFVILSATSIHYGLTAENNIQKLMLLSLITVVQMYKANYSLRLFLTKEVKKRIVEESKLHDQGD